MMLGHFSFSPSNQRKYKSSAMGDFRDDTSRGGEDVGEPSGLEDGGKPDNTSCSSVTTSPFEVISLFLVIRL